MNNEPVAWMNPKSLECGYGGEVDWEDTGCIPLYTHPAKTLTPLTEDECRVIIEKYNWFAKSWAEMAMEIQDAILKKAQEK